MDPGTGECSRKLPEHLPCRGNLVFVALESTVIAHGLPWPLNLETARGMIGEYLAFVNGDALMADSDDNSIPGPAAHAGPGPAGAGGAREPAQYPRRRRPLL